MDTSEQAILVETPKREARRRRAVEEKRRIVEETLEAGASVARVARRHAVNANQVFYWRKKYREGRLGKSQSSKLLPVTVSDISWSKSGRAGYASSPSAVGSMEKTRNQLARIYSMRYLRQLQAGACWTGFCPAVLHDTSCASKKPGWR